MSGPLLAILRGIEPEAAVEIAAPLVEIGFDTIEIPLNSPRPLVSIERLAEAFGDQVLIGAGTVLTADEVDACRIAGSQVIVSPNMQPMVIERAAQAGLQAIPGVMTPTECFAALAAGATALKLFPASLITPGGLAAMRAVLPPATKVFAVGGVAPPSFRDWLAAGVHGFGIGTALYQPGMRPAEVATRAWRIVDAFEAARREDVQAS